MVSGGVASAQKLNDKCARSEKIHVHIVDSKLEEDCTSQRINPAVGLFVFEKDLWLLI